MEDNVKKNFAGFIFNTFLCFNLSERFSLYNDNLVFIQRLEKHLQFTREYKYQLVYKRMQLVKDILVTHYSKKSNKSKKHAKKFIKEAKKIFDRTRVDDYKLVKSQWKNWTSVQVLQDRNLYDSIDARTNQLIVKILTSGKIKNKEGEKLHKESIDQYKAKVEGFLKKIRIRTKKIDDLQRDLIGINDKEIKEL